MVAHTDGRKLHIVVLTQLNSIKIDTARASRLGRQLYALGHVRMPSMSSTLLRTFPFIYFLDR
jgi:hypothetical protein